tara:strand:+ start:151 stop:615 length:465 start_codon:yes stop_codon:yes gene_type:complete
MTTTKEQRLIAWTPIDSVSGKSPSFGEVSMESPDYQTLMVTLPYDEGKLRLQFNDVRAFMTSWDGDSNPYVTFEDARGRPDDLLKVENSRWLASPHFYLDIESSIQMSEAPWEHFIILASERSIHIAARDSIEASWIQGVWSGGPGNWEFQSNE